MNDYQKPKLNFKVNNFKLLYHPLLWMAPSNQDDYGATPPRILSTLLMIKC